ncbi:hypothetical protein ABVT39_025861 [Epinephelus coioides]
MTLSESNDTVIRAAAPTLSTGRQWMAKNAVQQAKSTLHHGDIVGQVQHGRSGFGFVERPPCWNKGASKERRKMVVAEIHQQEESSRCAKAVAGQTGPVDMMGECGKTKDQLEGDMWDM